MNVHINDLPIEVLRTIFLFLEPQAFLKASHTCSYWRQLAHWDYILLHHIQLYFVSEETNLPILRLLVHLCSLNLKADGEKSSTIQQFRDTSQESSANETLAITTPTPGSASPIQKFDALSTQKLPGISKTFQPLLPKLENGELNESVTKLPHDHVSLLFYHKLLRLMLVNLTLQPLYRIVASSQSFFPNYPSEYDSKSLPFYDECNSLSPDGLLLLSVKRNPSNDHFLYITVLDESSKSPNFVPYLRSVYSWRNDRGVRDVVLSRDLNYLGVSYHVGYVEVHDLGTSISSSFKSQSLESHPVNLNGTSSFAQSTLCLFNRQYPSSISYLALSAHCEVLFLRSQRLGGLIIVNLETGEEIDIPHYRLDLSMSLQYNDKVLLLSGWNETIIFGKATPVHPDALPISPGSLWSYFSSLIQNHISSYVPVEKAIALEKQNAYLGFDCSHTGGVSVKIILDEDELIGFVPLEKIGIEEEEADEEEDEEEEGEDEIENIEDEQFNPQEPLETSTVTTDHALTQSEQGLTPNAEIRIEENGQENGEQNGEDEEEGGGEDGEQEDEEDEEPEEEEDDRRSCTILKREAISLSDLIYCMSPDAKRLAIFSIDRIMLYVLRESTIDDALAGGGLPYQSFPVLLSRNTSISKLSFVGNDKLLAISIDSIMIYELTNSPEWTKSGQQPVKYLRITSESNIECMD